MSNNLKRTTNLIPFLNNDFHEINVLSLISQKKKKTKHKNRVKFSVGVMSEIVCITFFFQLKTTKNSTFLKKKNVKKTQILKFKLKYDTNEGTTNLTNLFCLSTTSYRLFICDPHKLTDIKNFHSDMVYIFTSTEYFLL